MRLASGMIRFTGKAFVSDNARTVNVKKKTLRAMAFAGFATPRKPNPMNKDNYQGLMEDHRVKEAFLKLHTKWLSANHRIDMNNEMDALALALGLNPLTLKPSAATPKA